MHVCPLTFAYTRLALDRMQPGEQLRLRLRGTEPRDNVPRTVVEQGHLVESITDEPDGTATLIIQRR